MAPVELRTENVNKGGSFASSVVAPDSDKDAERRVHLITEAGYAWASSRSNPPYYTLETLFPGDISWQETTLEGGCPERTMILYSNGGSNQKMNARYTPYLRSF